MKLSELMKGITPDTKFSGFVTADDMVLAIDVSTSQNAAVTDYAVVQMGISGVDPSLNSETKDTQYLRAGKSSTKTGTQRQFAIAGDMYIGDEAQDYMLSHQIKYGTGQKVVVNYVYFNMLTGIGEKGKATIAVNADGSGNSGDNAGIDIQLSKVGSAPEEFDYTVETSTEAILTALAITGATLTPAFSSGVTAYTAETTEANGTITATGTDGATVAIAVNGATSEDGSATWTDGVNNVVITVKTDKITRTYTVEVTKTTA